MRKLLTLTAVVLTATVGTTATQAIREQQYHFNTHKHSMWHFPKSMPKLKRYRTIARHDQWVKNTAKAHPKWFSISLVNFHKREFKHAQAHIKKIEARMTREIVTYPWWWVPLGICETGVNPPDPAYGKEGHPGGDGYEGWINFLNSTWLTYGGGQFAAHAYDASEYEQYIVTMRMHADVPWSQSNPACSEMLGM